MSPTEFCYWLQGYFELSGTTTLMPEHQVEIVKNHLNMVFAHHIDPKAGGPEVQSKLNELHDPGPKKPIMRC